MSFPSKADREKCWGAKDRYWECLESHAENKDACSQVRTLYESVCPPQWVKHFDRKRSYLLFKDKFEKEGYDPINEKSSTPYQCKKPRYSKTIIATFHLIPNIINMEEIQHGKSNLDDCYNYLLNLSARNVHQFNLKYFKELLSPIQEGEKCDKNATQNCCTLLLKFLEDAEKQYRLGCDVAHAFCLVLSSQNRYTIFFCLFVSTVRERFPRELFVGDEELARLLRKYSTILLAGLLKYLRVDGRLDFEDEFRTLWIPVKKHIFNILSTGEDLYALLHVAEFLLDLVGQENSTGELLDDVSSTVMCVVANFWNHHISEVRTRVHRLSVTCLKLNYDDVSRKTRHRNTLRLIVNLKLFKAFANDMFWSVPYKYFAYLAGLEFYAQFLPVSEFLLLVRADMQEGFTRSLQNKRVISSETDLFKFCTRSLSLEQWKQIFQPVVEWVISSNDVVTANNFSRYWLPVILKKYPEYAETLWSLLPTNHEARRNAPHSRILFALLKVCHKYDISLPAVNDTDENFHRYLESCFADVEDTRGELFSLLCNLREQSTVPTENELRLILRFLQINAHSSSTILRQQIFSSFASFVLRVHCAGVKALKMNAEEQLRPLLQFLKDFSAFLIEGMQPGCSYQRKIISLTLYKIFMSYAIASCGHDLRRNNLKDTEKFVDWVKERGGWRFTNDAQFAALFRSLLDPCAEIQNTAFLLLRSYFDLTSVEKPVTLFEEGLLLMRNNQFYKRNSGVAAVLSLICLAYNTGPEVVSELLTRAQASHSTFTRMFLSTLRRQTDIMEQDTLNSAVYEPLDATIKVLTFLVTDVSSPEREKVSGSEIETLIELLENIVPSLLRALFVEDFEDYAPSFEESDLALQRIIEKSSITDQLELEDSKEDEFQLKPLYQILLNFIWISLKACCECESKLVTCLAASNRSLVVRCCDLIVKKLRLCRHKGVIEAAGMALSNVVQVLTAHNICDEWLDTTLMNVIQLIRTKSSASVSRKSAGLSLLVQNIVGNDRRTNKPSLQKCYLEFRGILDVDYETIDVNVSSELPQTHALHLLRVMIADARNSADLLPYFEGITLLCLRTLKAPFWIMRNASLQLFGAILPKIVGQKNTQNDFGVRRSFEEIFSCMPGLLEHIVFSLEETSDRADSSRLISHSNLVPLLVLLCNAQVASVSVMEASCRTKLLKVRQCLKSLLGSEVYHVRKLAGKAFISLHCQEELAIFKRINDDIVGHLVASNRNENLVHGQLLMLKQAFAVHSRVARFREQILDNLSTVVTARVKSPRTSLMSETLLHDLGIKETRNLDWKAVIEAVKNVLSSLEVEKRLSMGYKEWTQTLLKRTLENSDECSIVDILNVCLRDPDRIIVENTLQVLDVDAAVLRHKRENVVDLLRECMEYHLAREDHSVSRTAILNLIFEVLLGVCGFGSVNDNFCQRNYDRLNGLNVNEYQANNLRVLCLALSSSRPDWVLQVLTELHDILRTTRYNRDIRLNAAEGIKLLCNVRCENAEILILLWRALIDMLCDEEDDIRSVGCLCVRIFEPTATFYSPDEAVEVVFDSNFMSIFVRPEEILVTLLEHIWLDEGDEHRVTTRYSGDEIVNPFDQGVGNSYREDVNIISRCGKTVHHLISANRKEYFNETDKLLGYFSNLKSLVEKCDSIIESKFLVNVEIYTIAVRYYHLLAIAAVLLRHGFVSEVGGYTLSDYDYIIRTCNKLENNFHWESFPDDRTC